MIILICIVSMILVPVFYYYCINDIIILKNEIKMSRVDLIFINQVLINV